MGDRKRLAVVALALAGCEADAALHPGEYVEFVVEWDAGEPCLGSAPHVDRYVERVFEFFGQEPGDFEIAVHLATSASCKDETDLGCFARSEGRAYVFDESQEGLRPLGVTRHEVTHAIVDRLWGSSAPFFEEGLAEALTRMKTVNSVWTPEVGPVAASLASSESDRELAATFTRYLIDRGGLDAFREVYQRARGKSQAEIVAQIEAVYGIEFAALEADYASGAPRCTFQRDLCDPDGAEVVDLDAPWSKGIAASCLSPRFYGVQSIATQVRVNVEATGRRRVRLEYDGLIAPQVELTRCGDCGVQSVQRVRNGDEVDLQPGLYTFEVVGPVSSIGLDP